MLCFVRLPENGSLKQVGEKIVIKRLKSFMMNRRSQRISGTGEKKPLCDCFVYTNLIIVRGWRLCVFEWVWGCMHHIFLSVQAIGDFFTPETREGRFVQPLSTVWCWFSKMEWVTALQSDRLLTHVSLRLRVLVSPKVKRVFVGCCPPLSYCTKKNNTIISCCQWESVTLAFILVTQVYWLQL